MIAVHQDAQTGSRGSRGTFLVAALGTIIIALQLTACRDDPKVSSACAAAIEWRNNLYLGDSFSAGQTIGSRLGRATIPACRDTPDSQETATRTEIRRLRGVRPEVALYVPDEAAVYVRPGYACRPTSKQVICRPAP